MAAGMPGRRRAHREPGHRARQQRQQSERTVGAPKTVAITNLPWRFARRVYLSQERLYRRVHGLQAVGELIYLGRTAYRGPGKILSDRTRINPGDPLGVIHFDNLRLAAIEQQPGSPRHRAFEFLRLLRGSLTLLAEKVRADSELDDIAGFRGITWMPSRGRHLGFETEPLPSGIRARWLKLHFRLMLHAFYPEGATGRVRQPYIYWLTRRTLLNNHAPGIISKDHESVGAC